MTRRYVVGIDLGTTNCAVALRDTSLPEDEGRIEIRGIPQLVNPAEVSSRPLLPSFMYLPGEMDFPAGTTALPWDEQPSHVIGELARKRGAENPARLVSSAKSWLSYAGAQRLSPILPWGAPPDVPRVSPVDASAQYLRHLAAALKVGLKAGTADVRLKPDATGRKPDATGRKPDATGRKPDVTGGKPDATCQESVDLAEQDVLITIPASFDEEARELTLRAALAAGLKEVTLLEEPQAAFYAWLDAQGPTWRRRVRVGDLVLVCDIGGGTTDFSLIAVSEQSGGLSLERVAVGDHILLGGDNMDLALARLLQGRLEEKGQRLDMLQVHGLWQQCRAAKEALLSDSSVRERPITLLGKGSRLIGGTITIPLALGDVNAVLLDGFFPVIPSDEMPARQRRVGLQELGLPYAADPGITRHLARFLARSATTADSRPIRRGAHGLACPTHVLFNGGVLKASALRDRIVSVLDSWLLHEGLEPITVLDAPDLDHAVARGAAYYGMARHGHGIRIRSGASRSYYVGIESAMPAVPGMPAPLKALCVVPFGMEEGTSAPIPDRQFGLVVGEPAEFRFLTSTIRKTDPPGALIEDWGDELEELGPLEVTLPVEAQPEDVLPVTLESHVNEVGTLELWCVARDGRRWKLELNIRDE